MLFLLILGQSVEIERIASTKQLGVLSGGSLHKMAEVDSSKVAASFEQMIAESLGRHPHEMPS